MADQDTARLCVQIIRSHFGPLTATVASVLLTRGRLSLAQVTRFSSLKPRTVMASILVLVQHNLAWHATSDEEGEMIEFNVEECLTRLRFGQFVWQAENLFGLAAGEIVSLILDHGQIRPPDVIAMLSATKSKESAVYSQALHKLVTSKHLKPATELSHTSPRDKLIQYEADAKKEIKNFPTTKELRHAKEKAEARLKREKEEAEKGGFVMQRVAEQKVSRGVKRKAVDEEILDDSVYFRVNMTKFNIHVRNKLIETAARERFNESAAIVMRAVLKATEAKQLELSEIRSDPISLSNIASHISDDDDLAGGLSYGPNKRPTTMALIKDYLGLLAAADNPTPAGRASAFLSFVGSTSGKVQVEFETICRRLRRRALEAVARERYGDEAVRIIRFLLDEGKMNAENLAKVAMMANKDMRPLLTSLSADSLVSVQEVPKGADRNPIRTFYIWYVDLHKAYTVILGNLYKTLYNIGARRRAEEEDSRVKPVLEKCERSDVRDDASLLNRVEREVLKDWEDRRDKLTILEMRVEEAVFILRDLGVLGIGDE
ncbi:hypothetical protein BD410DRAFT_761941 [Rickenella mellea]|uniref:DNA-directed RNA polymerase III subunit RPC3 n=1 Tax=Rickenella mellea TaxID=50990 RepID=A0A4Y7QHV6_9AGAM|nr:hypothetical protein BD410DRAFT_761941 [Rickenella mellea]